MKKRVEKVGSAVTDILLPWLILALVLLVILMVTIFVLKGKNIELITQIKNLFRRT